MSTFKRTAPGPRKSQRRGATVVLFGTMLVVLMAMVAFGTDSGHLALTRTTLRAAADSAALAAAGGLTASDDIEDARALAVQYAMQNVPDHYGNVIDDENVIFGTWDPGSQTFTPDSSTPTAVKVVLQRTVARGNPVAHFFGHIFGPDATEMMVEAIAVGAPMTSDSYYNNQVYVTSSKDLSNVVLEFADGTHQKFDSLSGYTGTFQGTGENAGKEVVGVWIKSGCNASGDGPGYGERVMKPEDGSTATAHGQNAHQGCTPHVTATFQSTGVEFTEAGFVGPVRLVK